LFFWWNGENKESKMDVLNSSESGDKYLLEVDGLGYDVELPYVLVPAGDSHLRIASFNLVGQTRLNRDLGLLLAEKIRASVPDPSSVVILTAVEKALQLTQVVSAELNIDSVAVAYNRIKPHMEVERRPVIQVGADSITSGSKFLAVYERDMQLLTSAANGFIIIDDVVSTGGTIMGLYEILEEASARSGRGVPQVHGIFCAATEGKKGGSLLPAPIHSLAELPVPQTVQR
jgi:adenine phosphoribosyltransferase